MASPSNKDKTKVTAFQSVVAGAIAGSVESCVTYPAEYIKTRIQLLSKESSATAGKNVKHTPWSVGASTVREKGIFGLYKGLSAQVIGTASKAAVRFLVFDQIKAMLADKEGKVTGIRMVLAGLAAGVVEAIVAVTPTETIKTKLIHDQNQPSPRYKGLVHGTRMIIKESGWAGIYQGVTTVVARQGANSAVRLSCYGLIREKVQSLYPNKPDGTKAHLPWYATFGIGGIAGTITVYTTMPLDVLKTKMQALDAKSRYRNSLDCLGQVVKNEGVLALWKGATPRLGRLIFSGGIVFTVYEEVVQIFKRLG